jgi:outer membrane lipoprotein carrier protein
VRRTRTWRDRRGFVAALVVLAAAGIAASAQSAATPAEKSGKGTKAAAEKSAAPGKPAPKKGSDEAKAVAKRVQDRYDDTKDLSAEFTQQLRLAAGGQVIESKGRMFFAKPGRMRWEYVSPEPQTIIADGKTLWVHQPEDAQVLKAPLRDAFHSDTPVSFLFGMARLERDFAPSIDPHAPEGTLRLRLDPIQEDRALGVLFLDVDPKTFDIRTATIRDALGNRTEVHLIGLRRNEGVDKSLFVFERPPGTDVIEAPAS